MSTANRTPANHRSRGTGTATDRRCAASSEAADPQQPPMLCLPAPAPETIRAARAHLTPRYATGVDQFLWESRQRPMPDRDAIHAVITASARAQSGAGLYPEPMEIAAALTVLGAARLDLDHTEAHLLNAAHAAAMNWEQIAKILNLSTEETQERHRQLEPRLDQPFPLPPSPLPPHTAAGGGLTRRRRARTGPPETDYRSTWDEPSWDEPDDQDHGAF